MLYVFLLLKRADQGIHSNIFLLVIQTVNTCFLSEQLYKTINSRACINFFANAFTKSVYKQYIVKILGLYVKIYFSHLYTVIIFST